MISRRQFLLTAVTAVLTTARYYPLRRAGVVTAVAPEPCDNSDKPLIAIPFFVGGPGSRQRTYLPMIEN